MDNAVKLEKIEEILGKTNTKVQDEINSLKRDFDAFVESMSVLNDVTYDGLLNYAKIGLETFLFDSYVRNEGYTTLTLENVEYSEIESILDEVKEVADEFRSVRRNINYLEALV